MSESKSTLKFVVNGKKVVVENPDPEWTLIHFLRNKLRLTGTKLGCSEGGCGACTVVVSRFDGRSKAISHYSVNSCLAPVCSMHGLSVTTVEGLGSTRTQVHPVQEAIATSHGSQCGFCTPGIVMSMYSLLCQNAQPTVADIEDAFQGNLCRCTGYRPILAGYKELGQKLKICNRNDCDNKAASNGECCINRTEHKKTEQNGGSTNTDVVCQEPIFPIELQECEAYDSEELVFHSARVTWYRPVHVARLLELKSQYPTAKLVTGNTEIGIETKFKNQLYPVIVATTHISELNNIEDCESGLRIGAGVTLATIDTVLKQKICSLPAHKTKVFSAIVEMLKWFAGHQIRNVSAIGGNIITASPISDLNPLLLAAGATLVVASKERGERTVVMDHNFFCGYRRTAVKADEVVLSVTIPYTSENEYFSGYKQSPRREDDIAIANAGFHVLFEENSDVIKDIRLAFGGMAPTTVLALNTARQLIGRKWNEALLDDTCSLLASELKLAPGTPGGMEAYRLALCLSFFCKTFVSIHESLLKRGVSSEKLSMNTTGIMMSPFHRAETRGLQVYEDVNSEQVEDDALGRPLIHQSAVKQATGEAMYCDDIPHISGELYLTLVTSQKAHANILSVDASDALKMPGVVDFINYKDVPGENIHGHAAQDEEVFASKKVTCQGHVIGAIIANTQAEAQRAARAVKIQYEELPAIVTIKEAIAASSYMSPTPRLSVGNTKEALEQCEYVVEGEVSMSGQEHFYMETQATLALPVDNGNEMEVYCSTQGPSYLQKAVAHTLGLPSSKVMCRCKRLGGGFGGKETRYEVLALPVAVAAYKHQVPVRCMLDRDEDMAITGGRHPYYGKYKVGCSSSGKIVVVELELYANCGNTLDLSLGIIQRALTHFENAYYFANFEAVGYMCKTNLPSNTAFRGFGGPQGMLVCETIIEHVAAVVRLPPEKVREVNMLKEGDVLSYGMPMINCNVERCWRDVISQSNYNTRRASVDNFNRENRWKKRGIAVMPTKFGISFGAIFLNQGSSLVHIIADGSVLISHGGVEMGQGLHTKLIQVASHIFSIPVSLIHISETNTSCVPNASATAASASSDIYGMAVMKACQTLYDRLTPYRTANPEGTWHSWVNAAYFDRVHLSATGFYKTPIDGYNWDTGKGQLYNYFTYGAACSEVEIDCLTGDHVVLRTDIVMDVGTSLNPAIDVGQIEGAFVQGYGLFTLEEPKFSPSGFILTRGPGVYKLPGFADIPIEFNVSLLKGSSNPRAVYSSKAIGEPPLFLAASVFLAIRDAISSARSDAGHTGYFTMDSPATAERIRMACTDQFTDKCPIPQPGTYKPWYVTV